MSNLESEPIPCHSLEHDSNDSPHPVHLKEIQLLACAVPTPFPHKVHTRPQKRRGQGKHPHKKNPSLCLILRPPLCLGSRGSALVGPIVRIPQPPNPTPFKQTSSHFWETNTATGRVCLTHRNKTSWSMHRTSTQLCGDYIRQNVLPKSLIGGHSHDHPTIPNPLFSL